MGVHPDARRHGPARVRRPAPEQHAEAAYPGDGTIRRPRHPFTCAPLPLGRYDPSWNKYGVLDTGKYGMNENQAYNGPDPSKAFPPASRMPDFTSRLFPFWKYP